MRFSTLASMACAIALLCARAPAYSAAAGWPEWNDFVARFVQEDGRVIDVTFEGKSTSEGQSYALFFALVAGDRERFDTILAWTSDNLAGGRLGDVLPAWHWGKRDDGSWGIKDENAASDADLWLAYTLLEAARLWQSPEYADTGRRLLALVREKEVVEAGAAGTLLLPGPVGFALEGGRYRVNPSYLPGFMFHYLASVDTRGPWASIWESHLRLAPQVYAAGVAPDLFVVDARGRVTQDSERAPSGSYDAIRVYTWAGMSGGDSAALLKLLTPYAALVRSRGAPPEKVEPATGRALESDYSPAGYSGALLPFLSALGEREALETQLERLQLADMEAKRGAPVNYYDRALILFGKGWLDGRYAFEDDGRLTPAWAR
jgi:endoglucanase